MGTVFKRGQTYWIQYFNRGKRIRESAKTDKKTVADRFLKQREGRIAEGRRPGVDFDRVTYNDLALAYIAELEADEDKDSKRAKDVHRLHLMPYFGDMTANEINPPYIRQYRQVRGRAGASKGTINRELALLKAMYNLGADDEVIERVPKIPMYELHNTRENFFEHDEFLALREALPEHIKGLVTFAYKTGCRRGEIVNLEWSHIDMKEGKITLPARNTKTKEARVFFADSDVREVLSKQFVNRRTDCPYVFQKSGKQVGEFRKSWKTACDVAGVPGARFHDFRRTAIRNMIRAGIDRTVAKKISGHKTDSVFERYNITSEQDLREAALKLSGNCG
ncbi:MAG: site-specific integrase [Candidatus Krumholzibacteria bacterium]|nr:site-specific integrase [Candidatus Krumholzibacteria bacterium]